MCRVAEGDQAKGKEDSFDSDAPESIRTEEEGILGEKEVDEGDRGVDRAGRGCLERIVKETRENEEILLDVRGGEEENGVKVRLGVGLGAFGGGFWVLDGGLWYIGSGRKSEREDFSQEEEEEKSQ